MRSFFKVPNWLWRYYLWPTSKWIFLWKTRITDAIKGTSRDKTFQELGLESIKSRRWHKRLSCVFKMMKEEASNYLINFVPKCETNTRTRNNRIPTFNCQTDCLKYSFLPSTLNDWFNLDLSMRNSEAISILKSR